MLHKIDYQKYSKPSDFLKFKEGLNTIRIVSAGGLKVMHGMRTATGYIPLGNCTEDEKCEFCAKGNEPKTKWTWICYVPETNEVKLLEAGAMIGDRICKIALEKGDPQEYDLAITKAGSGLKSKYTVTAGVVKPFEQTPAIKTKKAFLVKKYFTT